MDETKTITITKSDHYAVESTLSFWTSRSELLTLSRLNVINFSKYGYSKQMITIEKDMLNNEIE